MQGRPLTGWLGRGRLLQQSLGWILSLPISQAWLRDMLRLLRFAALVLPALTLDKQHARDIGVCMVGQLRGAGGGGGEAGPITVPCAQLCAFRRHLRCQRLAELLPGLKATLLRAQVQLRLSLSERSS